MKLRYFLFITLIIIILPMVVICQKESAEQYLNELYSQDGEQYFKFELKELTELATLTKIISIDKIGRDGYVYAYANKQEFARFMDYGLPFTILDHPGDYDGVLKMLDISDIRDIQEWDFYPTYEAYVAMMNQFASDYPDLCHVFSIGNSIQGRQLLVAKISDNVGIEENEPRFLYSSSMHGDETTGYVLMLRLIDYLLSNYGTDPRITDMVNNIEIWINPLANPDGTYAGGNNTVDGARRGNALFVDLNRNYPDPADGPHPDGKDWQVETIAFMQMAEEHHFVSGANMHGGAEVCNYPWDTWEDLHADNDWWVYVCREYADTVHAYAAPGYMTDLDNGITNGFAWYWINGGRQDYMTYFQQGREFTLEISGEKLLPPEQLPAHWNYNYRSLLNYLEQSTFGIRGTVNDSITGWPIRAEVFILLHEQDSSWTYSTLPNGNYHRLVDEGTYSVRYSAPGYFPRVISNVNVERKHATILNVKLLPEGVGGIDSNPVSRMIQMLPNPVQSDFFQISAGFEIYSAGIYNSSGMKVTEYKINSDHSLLPAKELPNGIYIVKFETEKGPGVKKMIINR